ncbi:hypothetical protein EVAR_85474_1 [Eumeta japonica]|uniref:Uncharacterized protein n=1 Tax=Eumeta variegata TaxID=151549 RepID=A0A4C1VD79_EUMVA|nr:hypothetical protein EVAR_85474_1 [Eumeta japonica]
MRRHSVHSTHWNEPTEIYFSMICCERQVGRKLAVEIHCEDWQCHTKEYIIQIGSLITKKTGKTGAVLFIYTPYEVLHAGPERVGSR